MRDGLPDSRCALTHLWILPSIDKIAPPDSLFLGSNGYALDPMSSPPALNIHHSTFSSIFPPSLTTGKDQMCQRDSKDSVFNTSLPFDRQVRMRLLGIPIQSQLLLS